MSQWISISRADDRFLSYLKGTFSADQRALPHQTLQKDTPQEEVVFRILNIDELNRPATWRVWLEAIRWKYLSFTVMPMISALTLMIFKGWALNALFALSSFFGVVCLQIAAHLFNDYSDHFRGWDRLQTSRGGRSIQKGWLTALEVQKGGVAFLFSALLLGAPVVFQQPKLLAVVGVFALVGVMEFSSNRLALKYRGLGELTLMILGGPLVTVGFSLAVSSRFDGDVLALGLVFGFLASYVYYLKNIEELMVDSSNRHATLAVALGFDRAKQWAFLGVWGLPLGLVAWAATSEIRLPLVLVAIAVLPKTFVLSQQVTRVVSHLSSGLGVARTGGLRLHFLTGCALALAFALNLL